MTYEQDQYPESVKFTELKSLLNVHQNTYSFDSSDVPKHSILANMDESVKQEMISIFEGAGFDIANAPCFFGYTDCVLFAKDHGFTLRISKTSDDDFYRRFHGSVPTPLGWGNLPGGYTFHIYPGELLVNNDREAHRDWTTKRWDLFEKDVQRTNYSTFDTNQSCARNMGFVKVGVHKIPILIDTDCLETSKEQIQENKKLFNAYADKGMNPGHIYEQIVLEQTPQKYYQEIALRHQDVRQAFFEAWPGAHDGKIDYDRDKMQEFFNLAYDKVQEKKFHPSWKKKALISDSALV